MTTLSRDLRNELERTVIKARRVAEEGARKTIEAVAVHNDKPWSTLSEDQKRLRVRLRAHGRQLGDHEGKKRDTQTIDHLVQECAYEHWHRMLFARFLAENDLLIEPDSGVPISLEECRELALERRTDWLALASDFGVRMLPQIFRRGDPVLEVTLPRETRQELEEELEGLPAEVFRADDSLGWVYEFWQRDAKKKVDGEVSAGRKVSADLLPAKTQFFTEDYMVLFLLENTLGAWWIAKRRGEGKDAVLPGYQWTYLRLNDDGMPTAGFFDGWPRAARHLRVLDPCMGSGHFLTFALPVLARMRMEEESLALRDAIRAVLRDNLFGLELDARCSQIAAFNLALTAWRTAGEYFFLPEMNLACSGLAINASEPDWVRLAGEDSRAAEAMRRPYSLFKDAPALGSLIDPLRFKADLYAAGVERVLPLLEEALKTEDATDDARELAVAAQGLLAAFRILMSRFTLVATNVPYLGRGKQNQKLTQYCAEFHADAKVDLATCFVDRCLRFCADGGSAALVTPQNWLFLTTYKKLRERLLRSQQWDFVARLGEHAFESPAAAEAFAALLCMSRCAPSGDHKFGGWDVSNAKTRAQKAEGLRVSSVTGVSQSASRNNPDAIVTLEEVEQQHLLSGFAIVAAGSQPGQTSRLTRYFWEVPVVSSPWVYLESSPDGILPYSGKSEISIDPRLFGKLEIHEAVIRGGHVWKRKGVLVAKMRSLPGGLYCGSFFDDNTFAIVPHREHDLPAIWAFVSSGEFGKACRKLNQKLNVTVGAMAQVGYDDKHWAGVASRLFPNGLPRPESNDPTQWLFNGHPKGSNRPLQVAVARLLGYRWPRQAGSSFVDCPALGPDGLEKHADRDGIACLSPVKGQAGAADRLRSLLADAYGSEWSAGKLAELLSQAGFAGETLENWLHDGLSEQHCGLFHQRPFIWHIWDGRRDGFHALVNYHKLTAPNGAGRQTLEKLTYAYLGDWLDRQRADQRNGVEGADARVAAAQHLQSELKKILEGEPPYDLFVRWKPLHEQPIGWEPDINGGVRINIRPFMTAKLLNGRGKGASILRASPNIRWEKDRGKEPHRAKEDFPWFWAWDGTTVDFTGGREFDGNRWNNLHYSLLFKQAARDHQKQEAR